MNWDQIDQPGKRVIRRLKAAFTTLRAAIGGEWLARLRLKDRYAKKRSCL